MSNLGGYQTMTTMAKKCGGPAKFVFVIAVGGYVVFRTGELVSKRCIKRICNHNEKKKVTLEAAKTYNIIKSATSNEGVVFQVGDTCRVLGRDDDSILVELIGADNNPYFVSADFLGSISDFE